jgi:hypothetical protein
MCVQRFKILLVEHKPTWKGDDQGDDGIFQEWIEEALVEYKQDDSPCYTLTKIETYEKANYALSQDNPDYHLLITDLNLAKSKKKDKNCFIAIRLLDKANAKNISTIAVSSFEINGDQTDELFNNHHIKGFVTVQGDSAFAKMIKTLV